MSEKKIEEMEEEIDGIKKELMELGEMRPGSLSKQYRKPKEKVGAYYQLSYMHKMKSRTDYVRPQFLERTQRQVDTYKRFKKLTERWVELGIAHAKLRVEMAKNEIGK